MTEQKYYGLILAGGRGTRFWPRSRKRHAKQVLAVGPESRKDGRDSLIQQTVDRLRPLIPPDRIWILTNGFVRDEIVRQLPEVPPDQIIAEPAQRNTAPAIDLAAHILASVDPEAVFGVFPSDHVIGNAEHYLDLVRPAFASAEAGNIAVLGVAPRWPETGYGYIEFPKNAPLTPTSVTPVQRFREKPDEETAKAYLASGNFYWNAGMFFWKAQTILDELQRYLPKTAALISTLPAFTDPNFSASLAQVFPQCEDISIDFAVLERSVKVTGVPCDDFGWNDVGSWQAVYELLPRDAAANSKRSETIVMNASGNYIDCGKKTVGLIGVNDLIIVDTPDALLVADRNRAQDVGKLVKILEEMGREDLL